MPSARGAPPGSTCPTGDLPSPAPLRRTGRRAPTTGSFAPFLRASSSAMARSFRIQSTAKPNSNWPAAIVLKRFSICHDCAAPFEMTPITCSTSRPAALAKWMPSASPCTKPAMQIWFTIFVELPRAGWSQPAHHLRERRDDRLGLLERAEVPSHHHRQLAVLRPGLTSGHRRIQARKASGLRGVVELARHDRRGRGVVDVHRAGPHPRERAVGPKRHPSKVVVVADAGEHVFRALGRGLGGLSLAAAVLGNPFRGLRARTVEHRHVVSAALCEVACHGIAHHSESDECDLCHASSRLPSEQSIREGLAYEVRRSPASETPAQVQAGTRFDISAKAAGNQPLDASEPVVPLRCWQSTVLRSPPPIRCWMLGSLHPSYVWMPFSAATYRARRARSSSCRSTSTAYPTSNLSPYHWGQPVRGPITMPAFVRRAEVGASGRRVFRASRRRRVLPPWRGRRGLEPYAVGPRELKVAVRSPRHGPALFVHGAMMPSAQQDQVVEPRGAAVGPVLDVVRVGVASRAAREATLRVARGQRPCESPREWCGSCARHPAPTRPARAASRRARRRTPAAATFPRKRTARRRARPVRLSAGLASRPPCARPPDGARRPPRAAPPGTGPRRSRDRGLRPRHTRPAGPGRRRAAAPRGLLGGGLLGGAVRGVSKQPVGRRVERPLHHRAHLRRQPAAEDQHAVVVHPGLELPVLVPALGLLRRDGPVHAPPPTHQLLHVRGRPALGDVQELGLVGGRRDAGQGAHLRVRQLPALHRRGQARQGPPTPVPRAPSRALHPGRCPSASSASGRRTGSRCSSPHTRRTDGSEPAVRR